MSRYLQTNWDIWHDRARRIAGRSVRSARDIERSLSWYVGGRSFFTRYATELRLAHKWCFIVGCNNSGTSLLQQLLERTADVSTFPHEGQRYTRAMRRAEKRGHERVWSEYVDELRMTTDSSQQQMPRLLHDWLRELALPIHETILEKTTANAVRMPWLQAVFPRSYFIGVVRNGYAVTEGIRRKGNKSVIRGARHWNFVNKTLIEDAKHINKFILLKYEELAENPEQVAERLCDFIGLEPTKRERTHNIVAQIKDMNADSILRLSDSDRREIQTEAQPMLEYLNYTPAPDAHFVIREGYR